MSTSPTEAQRLAAKRAREKTEALKAAAAAVAAEAARRCDAYTPPCVNVHLSMHACAWMDACVSLTWIYLYIQPGDPQLPESLAQAPTGDMGRGFDHPRHQDCQPFLRRP